MEIDSKLITIDKTLAQMEKTLTLRSIIPGLGIVCGVAKVGEGALQMITGLVLTALLALPLAILKPSLLRWTASHIAHGFINILTGAVEAIPLIGSIVVYVRKILSQKRAEAEAVNIADEPKFTWIGYQNVYVYLMGEYPKMEPKSKLLPYLVKI